MADNLTTSRDISMWDPNDPKWAGFVKQFPKLPARGANTEPQAGEPGTGEGFKLNTGRQYDENDPVVAARRFLETSPSAGQHFQFTPDAELERMAKPQDRSLRQDFRSLTETVAKPAPYLGAASLAGLAGSFTPAAPVAAPLSVGAGALAAILSAPDVARRMILPDEDESRLGAAAEGALYGAGPALRSAPGKAVTGAIGRGARRGVDALEDMFLGAKGHTPAPAGFKPQSTASNYGGVGRNVEGLNTQKAPASQYTGKDAIIDEMVPQDSALRPFMGETPTLEAAAPRASRARAVEAPQVHTKESNAELLRKMNQESEAGYRRVPTSDLHRADETAGLGGITPEEWQKLGLRQVHQTTPTRMNTNLPFGEDLFDQLAGNERRLGIPARARAFREQQ